MTPTPSDAQPPEWIRVDREDGDHGFWTWAAATETSPKYIRADLFDAERQKREAAEERARILGDKYNQWFERATTAESALAKVIQERDEALSRVEELEQSQEQLAEDFEGDCWKAFRTLLNECNFDWQYADPDGVSADMALEHIRETLSELERERDRAISSLAEANARIAEQDRHIERLTTEGLYISEQFSGAAGDIVTLRARIAGQDRTVEHLQANNSSMAERWTKMLARIAELEAALRPFAAAAVEDDGTERVEWRYHDDDELVESTSALVEFTAGEFRRARAALTNIEKERDDEA